MAGGGTIAATSKRRKNLAGPSGWAGLLANARVFAIAIFASLGGLLYGYNQGVFSGVLGMYSFDQRMASVVDNTGKKGWFVAILELGAWFGVLCTGYLADRFSRKYTIVGAVIVLCIGVIVQTAAFHPSSTYGGRFVTGLGVGSLSMAVPLYNAELAPPEVRGSLVALQQLAITFGIMVSFWIDYGTNYIGGTTTGQSESAWRIPLGLQLVPAVILGVGTLFMPFSPRWLVNNGRDDEALQVLSRARRAAPNSDLVQIEFLEIKAQYLFEKETAALKYPDLQDGSWKSDFKLGLYDYISLLRYRPLLYRVAVGTLTMFFQQWTGVNAILYYAPTIFQELGLTGSTNSLLATGVVGIAMFLATIPAVIWVDQAGRKPVLISGAFLIAACHFIVAILSGLYEDSWPAHRAAGWAACALVWIFAIGFGYSWGPCAWIVVAEIWPLSVRGKGMSIAASSNWMNNFIVGQVTPTMISNIRFGTFIFFGAFSFLGGLFIMFFVPETKGLTLEEMDAIFGSVGLVAGEQQRLEEIERRIGLDAYNDPDPDRAVSEKRDSDLCGMDAVDLVDDDDFASYDDIGAVIVSQLVGRPLLPRHDLMYVVRISECVMDETQGWHLHGKSSFSCCCPPQAKSTSERGLPKFPSMHVSATEHVEHSARKTRRGFDRDDALGPDPSALFPPSPMADNINELLKELNPAQLQAVQHPPQIPLQILAGPGSGKTKVLTMRIAHLITNCYHPPWSICAVTFTNKAANEMRERLVKLVGKDNTAQIRMGTFHALCCNFLRRYARYVGIEGNFTVCDADESKKIFAKLLKPHQERLKGRNLTLKEATVLSMISKLKAKGMTADDALAKVAEANARPAEERIRRRMERGANDNANLLEGDLGEIIAAIYKEYEKTLREANSLDFDDLLVFGVRMFAGHKKASAWCRHVLVDEYQDTNTTQYELMRHIAQASKCVTIVGDPDQSIYGWRSAEITNLANMQRDFPNTQQIYLETNYRSTASILAASMAIISQDKNRIQKTLNTSHPKGPLPVLRAFPMEQVEAGFIAAEIKRIIAFTGGMLTWSDFVVLLRYNAHSRVIEAALQKEGIPNRVLAGHKFFERMEVKDVLAYLQLIDNPAFVPAFTRVVNVPSRTVGEKTVAELLHRASQLKLPPLTVVERIVEGKIPDIKPPVKRKLSSFVDTLRDLRRYAHEGMSPTKLITALVDLVGYQEHLRKTQPDHESRWENVQELINFASEVENGMDAKAGRRMEDAAERAHEELWGDGLGEWDRDQVEEDGEGDTPLRHFLQASMLSTDTETPEDEKSKDKVTISTCHAAKGLEWAVVMIPAVEDGVFPSARSEDTEEERRLLYVACTRAQGLLYLTHATSRMIAGEQKPTDLSPFIAEVRGDHQTRGVFSEELPSLPGQDRTTICKVLGRPPPDETEVKRRVAEFTQTGRHPVWGMNAPFRDVPGVPHNGYAVPARYPGQQAQAGQQSWGGGGGGQRLGGVPGSIVEPDPDGLEAVLGTAGPVKRDPDGPQEPPMFVASSILHFNNAHRAGIIQSAQQASTAAQLSNQAARAHAKLSSTPSSSRKGSANLQAPLASSSSRVVNTASSPASRGDIRDWFGQQDVDSQGLDLSSKAKGKARAAEAYLAMSSSKATPTPAKPASRVPARPLGMTASVARVKMEKTEPTLVKTEHLEPSQLRLKREPSLEEPPLGLTQRVRPAGVQGKSISGRIKSERIDLELPSGRQPLAEATPASLARSSTFSPRSVPGTGRVVTVKPPSTPSPFSSGQSLPSSSSASSSKSPSAAPVEIIDVDALDDPPVKPMTTKRRLGMGRATRGYANKKFKPLMPNGP